MSLTTRMVVIKTKNMVKIQRNSEIEPTLDFTVSDVLEKYRHFFGKSELGRLNSLQQILAAH
mgnify:CR=1 FL=1